MSHETKPISNYLFEDISGQNSAVSLLEAALEKQRIANAYLFIGPEGVGRKLTALRFLEGLINEGSPNQKIRQRLENRNHPDLLWVEPTYSNQGNLIPQSVAINEKITRRSLPQIRLEQIRNIKRFLAKEPVISKFGMVLIEDIETINEAAANALLKTLEEPNKGKFILISNRPDSLLKTIISRCQQINFNRLELSYMKEIFSNKSNSIKIDLSSIMNQKEILNLSNGSPGAIFRNLETWQSIPTELWPRLKKFPNKNPTNALSLAKDITEELDIEQQIWLISWLQQHIWIRETNIKTIKQLEKLRFQIQSFVNPRLAWEITLIQINNH